MSICRLVASHRGQSCARYPLVMALIAALALVALGCSSVTGTGTGTGTETGRATPVQTEVTTEGAAEGAAEVTTEVATDVTVCDVRQDDSWIDLSAENAAWRADSANFRTWTDVNGCAIRLDTIFHRNAAEDCGWELVEVLSLGLPIGTPYTGPTADPPGQDWAPSFVFNAGGAIDPTVLPPGRTITRADLPADVVDTGARSGPVELHMEPDESLVYMVSGDAVRVFAPDPEDYAGSCA